MTNMYIKPETTVCLVKVNANLMQGSIDTTPATGPAESKGQTFDFFSFEEEEEAPGKSDDEDWEDWEDEDDP